MQLQLTSDQSHTLFSTTAGETYHSAEGAVMEALHVYVSPAFIHFRNKATISLLEVGFGTGLNAFLTMLEAKKKHQTVYYETIEPNPVCETIYTRLNFPDILDADAKLFLQMHSTPYNRLTEFSDFRLMKRDVKIEDYTTNRLFDVIYYDAFSPNAQPEMWTSEVFAKIYRFLQPDGFLLTYSAKGIVKKALRAAGFHVERLPGAGSKHHMLKAVKQPLPSPATIQ